ncbi:MAG: hypothetical protein ACE5GY_10730 [Thermodesulfobacteriota bacterium]
MSGSGKDLKLWQSHEVLEETIRRDTPEVARALNLGPSIVGKWKEAPATEADFTQSGARNFLDRAEIVISTIERKDPERAHLPIKWLCARFRFFPPVKMPDVKTCPETVQTALLSWTREFGETCGEVSKSLADGYVSKAEMKRIYRELLEDFEAGMGLFMLLKEMGGE